MKFPDGIRWSSLSDLQNIIPDTEIDRKQRLILCLSFTNFFRRSGRPGKCLEGPITWAVVIWLPCKNLLNTSPVYQLYDMEDHNHKGWWHDRVCSAEDIGDIGETRRDKKIKFILLLLDRSVVVVVVVGVWLYLVLLLLPADDDVRVVVVLGLTISASH